MVQESGCNMGDLGLIPGLEGYLEKAKPPIPVFLPGEFHGQRSKRGRLWFTGSQRARHD